MIMFISPLMWFLVIVTIVKGRVHLDLAGIGGGARAQFKSLDVAFWVRRHDFQNIFRFWKKILSHPPGGGGTYPPPPGGPTLIGTNEMSKYM